MSKTPEQMAKQYVEKNNLEYEEAAGGYYGFLAGYEAGRKITDQEIMDFIVDIREREAKERSKAPPLQQERHDRIWEKVKVKLVGIF